MTFAAILQQTFVLLTGTVCLSSLFIEPAHATTTKRVGRLVAQNNLEAAESVQSTFKSGGTRMVATARPAKGVAKRTPTSSAGGKPFGSWTPTPSKAASAPSSTSSPTSIHATPTQIQSTKATSSFFAIPEKAWNIRYQLPGIVVNSHTLEIDFALNPRFTVGLIGNYTRQISNGDVSLEYTRKYYGVATHIFLTGDVERNGMYFKPSVAAAEARGRVQDSNRANLTKQDRGIIVGAALVYQFLTEGGTNLHVGFGVESRNYSDRAEFERSETGEQVKMITSNKFPLVGELTLGYAF